MRFEDLALIEPLAAAVRAEGYTQPTPIQERCIPHVLAGRDLLGLAQTGTGKTAAFALPILQRLHEKGYRPHGQRPIRVLVLTPTRELASQIGESFATYGKNLGYRHTVVYGGVGQGAQERALRGGIDIVVATPGRLLDLCGQRVINLSQLDIFVLDEADRMLDMGFVHDVRRVIALLPAVRQTLFFSATMPREAQALADALLKKPETVAVAPVSSTAERIDQKVYFVDSASKRALLVDVLTDASMRRVLVFTRTKHGANRVAEHLTKAGVHAEAIHGNKSQNARERALAHFKAGTTRVLVATDIAARGIDIDDITHVVNFDLPEVSETYVHRIGRTARAGASGIAVSFCDGEERDLLRAIERLTRQTIPVVESHPYVGRSAPRSDDDDRSRERGFGGGGGRGRGGGGGGRGGRPSFARGGGRGASAPAPSGGGYGRGAGGPPSSGGGGRGASGSAPSGGGGSHGGSNGGAASGPPAVRPAFGAATVRRGFGPAPASSGPVGGGGGGGRGRGRGPTF